MPRCADCSAATVTRGALLTNPDLSDQQANASRLDLLREYRGFDQADTSIETYLGGVPVRELAWWRVRIGAADVARMHYINWDFWVEVTGGTRLVTTHASATLAEPNGPGAMYTALRDAFLAGAPVPEIIMVDSGPDTRLVSLEGHIRATAMAMAGGNLNERLLEDRALDEGLDGEEMIEERLTESGLDALVEDALDRPAIVDVGGEEAHVVGSRQPEQAAAADLLRVSTPPVMARISTMLNAISFLWLK